MSRRSEGRDPDVLTPGKAAALLGVSREVMVQVLKSGRIPLIDRTPQNLRVHREEVEKLVERLKEKEGGAGDGGA